MTKKGDLSLTMIIGAAIGILVLAVIAYLVIETGTDGNNATECYRNGGVCKTDGSCTQITGENGEALACSQPGQTCCQPIG